MFLKYKHENISPTHHQIILQNCSWSWSKGNFKFAGAQCHYIVEKIIQRLDVNRWSCSETSKVALKNFNIFLFPILICNIQLSHRNHLSQKIQKLFDTLVCHPIIEKSYSTKLELIPTLKISLKITKLISENFRESMDTLLFYFFDEDVHGWMSLFG